MTNKEIIDKDISQSLVDEFLDDNAIEALNNKSFMWF